jgi:signal transduction histidine kinase
MRRAAQLASAGELASGIAHEIKNPLIGVASGVDLLERRLNDDPKSATVLGQMREQLKRIESAIRDLLSYAQPKKPRLIWTAPDQLVDRVVALIGSQAETAGVSIEKRVGGDARKIHVDPELMTQALVNLTLNGIQALGPGGVVGISTECVNGEVRISVSDTGAGIPKDRIEEIFRPFFTTKHQGTGLGLAITRGIVERHGGRLEVGSEEGQGSQFTLVFATTDEEVGAQ